MAYTNGAARGFMEDLPYKEESLSLNVGLTLFLYTDGITEAVSPNKELFGLDRLREILQNKINLRLDKPFTEIRAALAQLQQGQQSDDFTTLALKRNL